MPWNRPGRSRAKSTARRVFRPSLDRLEHRDLPSTIPAGFVETGVATGLNRPTTFEFAPDGRIFIAQQGGQIRVVKDGQLLPTPFLSLNVDSSGERGLLGVTFDPQFATNRFVYIYYTVPGSPAHNRVSRFTANGDVVQPGSEVPLLELNNLSGATNHNGGAIHFGPDGKLYIGVGENANGNNAQSLNNLLGKILRINPDGSIPSDNPFFNTASGNNRAIWALGLRNPYSFTFEPGTGRMFINDVGEDTWEEINLGVAGANYGWPIAEGPTTDPRFRSPVSAYRNESGVCAITGGAFYSPANLRFPADLIGDYFFTDLCGGWIHRRDAATGAISSFATDLPFAPVALGVDPGGSLYYLAMGNGANAGVLGRIQSATTPAGQAPTVTRQPSDVVVAAGRRATFSVIAGGTAPLSYQWQRNGVNIPGATGPTFTIGAVVSRDFGATFRVVVTNARGSITSRAALLAPDSRFVRVLFARVLGRAPTASALATLSLALARGMTPGQVARSLVASAERHKLQVIAAYRKFLGRNPTAPQLNSGLRALSSGVRPEALHAGLVGSPEYIARHGRTPQSVVRFAYRDLLGRAPTAVELSRGTRNFSATSLGFLARRLVDSNEARTRLIRGWYSSYLNRSPNSAELRNGLALLQRGLRDQAEAAILARI